MVFQGTVERTTWIKKMTTKDDDEMLPSSHCLFVIHLFEQVEVLAAI